MLMELKLSLSRSGRLYKDFKNIFDVETSSLLYI